MDRNARALMIGRSLPDEAPIWMTDGELLEGIAVAGPPGRGKRSVLLSLLAQQVGRGGGALFLEGGPSRRALGVLLEAAEAAGRLEAVRLYDPAAPERSHGYNPLLGKGVAPLARFLLHLGAPPTRRAGSAVDGPTRRAAEALADLLIAGGGPLTLATVRRHLAALAPADRERLARGASAGGTGIGPATWRRRLALELDRVLLNAAAAPLMTGAGQIDLAAVVDGGGLVYVGLGTLTDAAFASSLAAILLADLRVAVEARPTPPTPLLLLLDTAEAYLVAPLLGLLEVAPRTTLAPIVSLADPAMAPPSPLAAQVLARLPARLRHRVDLAPAPPARERGLREPAGLPAWSGRPGLGVVRRGGQPPVQAALALEDAPVNPARTEALRARLLSR